jgi:hypothetical protein
MMADLGAQCIRDLRPFQIKHLLSADRADRFSALGEENVDQRRHQCISRALLVRHLQIAHVDVQMISGPREHCSSKDAPDNNRIALRGRAAV